MPYIVNIRPRRQITIPASLLQQMSLAVGDKLAFQIEDKKLIAKPLKNQSLDALTALQTAFSKARVSEAELQTSGTILRKKLYQEKYG